MRTNRRPSRRSLRKEVTPRTAISTAIDFMSEDRWIDGHMAVDANGASVEPWQVRKAKRLNAEGHLYRALAICTKKPPNEHDWQPVMFKVERLLENAALRMFSRSYRDLSCQEALIVGTSLLERSDEDLDREVSDLYAAHAADVDSRDGRLMVVPVDTFDRAPAP